LLISGLPSHLAAPIKKDAGVTHVYRSAAVIPKIIARPQKGYRLG